MGPRDVHEIEAVLYTDATSHVMHILLKRRVDSSSNQQITFSNSPLFPDPQQLAAISWQDRTQQSSLPVSPLWRRVKHGSGIQSAGGCKLDL